MIARRLFAKIFLWFWAANTAVIAALALVVWLYPRTEEWRPGPFAKLHELQVRGALAVRQHQGQEAFEQHARELEQAVHMRTYYFDEHGNELRGELVPEDVRAALANPAEPSSGQHENHDAHSGRMRPLVYHLRDDDGNRFDCVTEPPEFPRGRPPYLLRMVASGEIVPRVLTAVVAAGLCCYLLARYLTWPVRRLQDTVQELAAGDLAARVGPRIARRRDEIGELGREFDRMAGQIEHLLETQKRLLRDVSHELRSPLARLVVALELVRRDAGPAADANLGRATREAERLNELIGQILTLARLETGPALSDRTTVDLAALVHEAVADAEFEAAAADRHVRLTHCDAATLEGSPALLRSALDNVLRNALCYAPAGSAVDVSLRRQPSGAIARIEVRDRGPGVPEDALHEIFAPFYRVSGARERASGGSGLGLAIARQAVQRHGGTISALNAPDHGLIVSIDLPCP